MGGAARTLFRMHNGRPQVAVQAISRRLMVVAPLAVAAAGLLGCAETPAPPASMQVASNPDLVIRNLPPGQPALVASGMAAYGTVQAADAGTREVILKTTSGGTFTLTAGQDFRNLRLLRPGARVVAVYDANGMVRLASPPRNADATRPGVLRGTIEAVEVGGRRLVVAVPAGARQLVTIADPAMMAFATRLGPGDEVAITSAAR
ncbi:hypothetical protein AAFN86_19420 [Roseomonas sp. CAU 1739]|uniref:hypothetical protein n=1 Tax=Roseomonas sp. CAU 1739 TaxID=3140364 RepID=UPI00325A61AB